MTLFDDIIRDYIGPPKYDEPDFTYLNRSARRLAEKIREILERWFQRYPASEQEELRGRFRSPIDRQYQAAFFELWLHELFRRTGCQAQIHPELRTGSTKRVDFLVTPPDGQKFYVEAVVASGRTDSETAVDARLNTFYQSLDNLKCQDFILVIQSPDFSPDTPVPAKVCKAIQRWLSRLDYDVVQAARATDTDSWNPPEFVFEHEHANVKLVAVPRTPETRGRPGVPVLGGYHCKLETRSSNELIRDAVIKKAKRYGELDLPFLVAVSCPSLLATHNDSGVALFGTSDLASIVGSPESHAKHLSRCAWLNKSGHPTQTRVSGVLIVQHLVGLWSLCQSNVRIYHNPWARKPLGWQFGVLQETPIRMQSMDGDSLRALFDLPEGWLAEE